MPAPSRRRAHRGTSYRWQLTDEEREAVRTLRSQPIGPRDLARAVSRSPRLLLTVLRSGLHGAAEGVRSDGGLVFVVGANRIREVAPGAATGVNWHGEDVFLDLLRPFLVPTAVALELGAGAGRITRLVAPHVRELMCTDVSTELLAEARANLREHENVSFARTSGFSLPGFADASFDVVFAHDVFLMFDPNQALALLDEAARVLKPTGGCVISVCTIDRPAWADEQLRVVREAARSGRFAARLPRAYIAQQVDALMAAVGLEVVARQYGPEDHPGARVHYVVAARVLGEKAEKPARA